LTISTLTDHKLYANADPDARWHNLLCEYCRVPPISFVLDYHQLRIDDDDECT
jgi:hypothetical protein